MARIILGSYMVRYPLGGMMSWVLQYLIGFQKLGHEVYFVEKSGYPNACFDPVKNRMTDDCSYGMAAVEELLRRHGLNDRCCYVDSENRYHGLSKRAIEDIFAGAAVFVDMGTHGSWREESTKATMRVLIDGEPAFTQLKMEQKAAQGIPTDGYNYYYTTGRNIGTNESQRPEWRPQLAAPLSPRLHRCRPFCRTGTGENLHDCHELAVLSAGAIWGYLLSAQGCRVPKVPGSPAKDNRRTGSRRLRSGAA